MIMWLWTKKKPKITGDFCLEDPEKPRPQLVEQNMTPLILELIQPENFMLQMHILVERLLPQMAEISVAWK